MHYCLNKKIPRLNINTFNVPRTIIKDTENKNSNQSNNN